MNLTFKDRRMTKAEKTKEMERRYDLLMPIELDNNTDFCRDTFLKKLFKELDLPEYEEHPTDSSTESMTEPDHLYTWAVSYRDSMSLSSIIQKSMMPSMTMSTRRLTHPRKTLYGSSLLFSLLSGQTDAYDELMSSLKRSSLYFMFSRAINRFRIMGRISLNWGNIDYRDLPHHLFSWSMDGFFTRCAVPDTTYLDLLQINYTEDQLDWLKFSVDIGEIIRHFKYFYTQTFLDKGYRAMMTPIWDQEQLVSLDHEMEKLLVSSKSAFDHIIDNSRKVSDAWWGRHRRMMVKKCKRRHTDIAMRIPIKWRYVRNYLAAMMEMQIRKDRQPLEALREECEYLEKEIQRNMVVGQQTMFVYSATIEGYEARLNYYNNKLNTAIDEWDDKNVQTALQVHKVKAEQQQKEAEINFMRKRVKEVETLLRAEKLANLNRISLGSGQRTPHSIKTVKPNERKSKEVGA